MTVLKNIDKLSSYDMIALKQDPKNRWSYNIIVNNESLLVQLIGETQQLKDIFFHILDQSMAKQNGEEKQIILLFLILLYRVIGNEYILRILTEWPGKSKNGIILNRAYSMLFSSLSNILFRLSSGYQEYFGDEIQASKILTNLFCQSNLLTDCSFIEDLMSFNANSHFKDHVSKLLEFALAKSSNSALYKDNHDNKLKNWQKLLELKTTKKK